MNGTHRAEYGATCQFDEFSLQAVTITPKGEKVEAVEPTAVCAGLLSVQGVSC